LEWAGGVGSGSVALTPAPAGKSPTGAVGAVNRSVGAGAVSAAALISQLLSGGVSGAPARLCGSIPSFFGKPRAPPQNFAITTVMLSSPPRSLARSIIRWQADLKSEDS